MREIEQIERGGKDTIRRFKKKKNGNIYYRRLLIIEFYRVVILKGVCLDDRYFMLNAWMEIVIRDEK